MEIIFNKDSIKKNMVNIISKTLEAFNHKFYLPNTSFRDHRYAPLLIMEYKYPWLISNYSKQWQL